MTDLKYDPPFTAERYDELAEGESARWERGAHMRLQKAIYLAHLRQRILPGDRVLDAGCGPATFASPMVDWGAKVTCLDLSAVQLELCRRGEPRADGYFRGSITDLPFANCTFDVSLAMGASLSYCFDRSLDAVRELRRVTRPGGLVGLSVANLMGTVHRWLQSVLSFPPELSRSIVQSGNQARDVNGHEVHLFRPKELQALLHQAGLDHVELHAPGWLSLLHDDLPEPSAEKWQLLLQMELDASAESPGAGTHILAWARVPTP